MKSQQQICSSQLPECQIASCVCAIPWHSEHAEPISNIESAGNMFESKFGVSPTVAYVPGPALLEILRSKQVKQRFAYLIPDAPTPDAPLKTIIDIVFNGIKTVYAFAGELDHCYITEKQCVDPFIRINTGCGYIWLTGSSRQH